MKIANEVKIGLLGLIALVTFVIGYNFLKGTGVFSSTKTVNVEYDNVQGLLVGAYVQINGLKVVFYESSSEPGPRLHSRLSGTRRTGTPNFGVSSFVSSFSFVLCDFRF